VFSFGHRLTANTEMRNSFLLSQGKHLPCGFGPKRKKMGSIFLLLFFSFSFFLFFSFLISLFPSYVGFYNFYYPKGWAIGLDLFYSVIC
jgi:hypothetical protein